MSHFMTLITVIFGVAVVFAIVQHKGADVDHEKAVLPSFPSLSGQNSSQSN